ncbi:MAG: LysR substrate-binding domain-containing protein [Verrucomicrobiota bacterium]
MDLRQLRYFVAAGGIDREDVLHLTDRHWLEDQTPKRCRASGDEAPIECEQLTTLLSLVAAGLGVTFVPEKSLAPYSVPGFVLCDCGRRSRSGRSM